MQPSQQGAEHGKLRAGPPPVGSDMAHPSPAGAVDGRLRAGPPPVGSDMAHPSPAGAVDGRLRAGPPSVGSDMAHPSPTAGGTGLTTGHSFAAGVTGPATILSFARRHGVRDGSGANHAGQSKRSADPCIRLAHNRLRTALIHPASEGVRSHAGFCSPSVANTITTVSYAHLPGYRIRMPRHMPMEATVARRNCNQADFGMFAQKVKNFTKIIHPIYGKISVNDPVSAAGSVTKSLSSWEIHAFLIMNDEKYFVRTRDG